MQYEKISKSKAKSIPLMGWTVEVTGPRAWGKEEATIRVIMLGEEVWC
jgi:hypothetical protein